MMLDYFRQLLNLKEKKIKKEKASDGEDQNRFPIRYGH